MIKLLQNSLSIISKAIVPPHNQTNLHFGMATRKRRVRELSEIKISLNNEQTQESQVKNVKKYVELKKEIKELNWQGMSFDQLCNLPQQSVEMLTIQLKKDKFNIQDKQFYDFLLREEKVSTDSNAKNAQKLNNYYKRMHYLLNNQHREYDSTARQIQIRSYYKHQIYILNMKEDPILINLIQYFVNNVAHPQELESIVEPSFIKYLLSSKRQLMLQGIYFQELKEKRMKKVELKKKILKEQLSMQQMRLEINVDKKESTDIVSAQEIEEELQEIDNQISLQVEEKQDRVQNESISKDRYRNLNRIIKQELKKSQNKIKILDVLGYEYQFWVDVKHNRNKNGLEQDYIIQERQIDNPNQSSFIRQKFPKIKVKYILHKKKRKQFSMHFCIKANLMIEINGQHKRKVKVEWRGPSNKQSQNNEQSQYLIIDYEDLMNGNSTLKPIFSF